MRTRHSWSWSSLIAVLAIAGAAVAAPRGFGWRGGGGWDQRGAYGRMFDARTVTVVRGTIESFADITPIRGMGVGVHVMVRSGNNLYDVHLGPKWYLAAQDADLRVGDRVAVRGAMVRFHGAPAILAIDVRRGNDVLVLRDPDGTPRWSAWRHRAQPSS